MTEPSEVPLSRDYVGAVIALVGPDAAGKTTLGKALVMALCRAGMDVQYVHLGTPPGTRISNLCRLVIKGLRKVIRLSRSEHSLDGVEEAYPRFQAVLDVLTAYDRRALVRRCFTLALSGSVVITDRYPGRAFGSASGPSISWTGGLWLRWMSRVEHNVYRAILPPQLVVRILVPVEETVLRNATRLNPKHEAVIRQSHVSAAKLHFGSVQELQVDNTCPLDIVLQQLTADIAHFLRGT